MAPAERHEGRVVRAQSGFFAIQPDGVGCARVTAVMRGRLKRERQEAGLAALGDIVRYELLPMPEGDSGQVEAVITEVLPRRSALARRAPGPKGVWAQDVIVANIDQLVPVFAAARPEPHWRMLDRFLAIAEIDSVESTIVVNKTDLGVSDAVAAAIELYRGIGYRVLSASAKTGEGIDDLAEVLRDRISAVVGPSGVGKSTLLNAVEPGLGLRVGDVSDAVDKGRHTTRVGELHALSRGGLVADTPGLRELGVWQVDPGELEWAFVEFQPLLNTCRFYDCTHRHEPGCAVRAAVESGRIAAERYESYARLVDEEP